VVRRLAEILLENPDLFYSRGAEVRWEDGVVLDLRFTPVAGYKLTVHGGLNQPDPKTAGGRFTVTQNERDQDGEAES
jgi:hypothetical protein